MKTCMSELIYVRTTQSWNEVYWLYVHKMTIVTISNNNNNIIISQNNCSTHSPHMSISETIQLATAKNIIIPSTMTSISSYSYNIYWPR